MRLWRETAPPESTADKQKLLLTAINTSFTSMAAVPFLSSTGITFSLITFLLSSLHCSSSHHDFFNSSTSTTVFLPLSFNNHHHHYHLRRHLRSNSTARMSLHDDLALYGYYTVDVWIGTPPQKFSLIVDTGSTATYVPCSTCLQCGQHQDPKFQPQQSRTYKPVKCNNDCTCDNDQKQCTYERQYAELSTSSGVLGKDMISFGNQSGLGQQRAIFGCENMETGALFSQHADGIIGLGRGDISIVDQLVGEGVISNSFSICYGGMDVGGGAMALGGISPPPEMIFSHSDPMRSPYYNVELREIHVAGKVLTVNPRVFDGKLGTVLDSGTTYTYFPDAAFIAFKEAIFKEAHHLKQIPGADPSYDDICFLVAGRVPLSETFPSVEMVFSHGQKLLLSPENYLFKHSKVHNSYCLGVFSNGEDPTTFLGGIFFRNTLVTYDREHEKIGFWKTNCSELWQRLGVTEANTNIAPAPSPARPPLSGDPGRVTTATESIPHSAAFSREITLGNILAVFSGCLIGSISFNLYI